MRFRNLLRNLNVNEFAKWLAILALIIIIVGFIDNPNVRTFFQNLWPNLSTELASIALTILVIDTLNSRRAKRHELEALILQMGSPDNGFAVEAVRILRAKGWLMDGSLRGKKFGSANLQCADLSKADLDGAQLNWADLRGANLTYAQLQGVNLGGAKFDKLPEPDSRAATFWHADLRGAILGKAVLREVNLGGTDLRGANLLEADLIGATTTADTKFDENTILPDGKKWTPETDLNRYTSSGMKVFGE